MAARVARKLKKDRDVPKDTHVKVAVRCRPVLSHEAEQSTNALSLDSEASSVAVTRGDLSHRFGVDYVLPPASEQEDVFAACQVSDMVEATLNGYNCTVFAYGQTGSGKTYTMEGYEYSNGNTESANTKGPKVHFQTKKERLGVAPRSIAHLFDSIGQRNNDRNGERERSFRVRCSFLQIYNEKVFDLLNTSKLVDINKSPGLKVKWNRYDEFYVDNLFAVDCETADEAIKVYRDGVRQKVMGSHELNKVSSRSHSVFMITVESKDPSSPDTVICSKLSLVDLAGSERIAMTKSTGTTMREGIQINKSLFVLRQVIASLAEQSHSPHQIVPYRDSKLTRLLKHSLGGSSLTLMIACISPGDQTLDENLSTLKYASLAKNITNRPVVNEDPKNKLIRELREEVAFLKEQLMKLGHLQAIGTGGGSHDPFAASSPRQPRREEAPIQQKQTVAFSDGPAQSADGIHSERPEKYTSIVEEEAEMDSAPIQASEALDAEQVAHLQEFDPQLLGKKLIDSVNMIKELMQLNENLRKGYNDVHNKYVNADFGYNNLMSENQSLREQLETVERVVEGKDIDGGEGGENLEGDYFELKEENRLLKQELEALKRSHQSQNVKPPQESTNERSTDSKKFDQFGQPDRDHEVEANRKAQQQVEQITHQLLLFNDNPTFKGKNFSLRKKSQSESKLQQSPPKPGRDAFTGVMTLQQMRDAFRGGGQKVKSKGQRSREGPKLERKGSSGTKRNSKSGGARPNSLGSSLYMSGEGGANFPIHSMFPKRNLAQSVDVELKSNGSHGAAGRTSSRGRDFHLEASLASSTSLMSSGGRLLNSGGVDVGGLAPLSPRTEAAVRMYSSANGGGRLGSGQGKGSPKSSRSSGNRGGRTHGRKVPEEKPHKILNPQAEEGFDPSSNAASRSFKVPSQDRTWLKKEGS